MKKIFLPFLLTSLISMVGTSAFAHDIEVKNAEGKTIYYIWKNNKTELAVSYRGYYEQWDNDPYRYTGNIIIPEFVNCEGNTYRVRGIDDNAFSFCDQLTSITIPNSVTYFGEAAFQGCSGLTSIVSENKNPFDFYGYVFSNYTYSAKLIVPAGTKSAYQSKAGWSNFTNIVELKKRTVHVATAGTLPDLISDYDKSLIGELTLTGNLNGTDIGCIRRMAGAPVNFHRFTDGVLIEKNSGKVFGNLSVLDISGAKIVSGGEFYYRYWYNEEDYEDSYYTKNNVISSNMFHNCKFTKVSLPINVTSIDESAFYGCSSLTSVTIPNSVTSIGSSAFYGCSSLTSVTIPNSVTYIGVKAFYDCTNLNSIIIPSSISHIDEDAFEGCTSLNSVYISDISAWCGIRFEMGDGFTSPFCYASYLFLNGKEIKDIVIPDGMTSIGNQQFYGCSGLTTVTIPNSVKSIGDFAFNGCSGLTSIISLNNIPPTCTQYYSIYTQFESVDKSNCIVWVPKGSANAYKAANGWKDFQDIREINDQTCGDNVFWSYVEATKTLTISGTGAMTNYSSNNRPWNSYISSIQNVIIESGVTSIGDLAFYGCSGLTSVTIPNTVTSIGDLAFDGCSGLTSVIIPNSVTNIGESAFGGCVGLTSITIPNSVTSIGEEVFSSCSGLTSITIPKSVTSIETWAFSYCRSLTSIISLNNTPPTCVVNYGNYTQFYSVDKTNCIVWVPKGSANAYREADGWKDFNNIRELIKGDANVDGVVNVADVVEVVNAVNGKPSNRFLPYNADQTGNGVDTSDVKAIVDIIMQK